MNIKGLGHVGIWTDRLDATLDFYCKFLGFEVATTNADFYDGVKSYFLRRGNLVIEIMYDAQGKAVPGFDGPVDHLSMEVDDVDAAYAELKANGFQIETEEILFDPHLYRKGQRFFMFRGPSGERLQIEQNL